MSPGPRWRDSVAQNHVADCRAADFHAVAANCFPTRPARARTCGARRKAAVQAQHDCGDPATARSLGAQALDQQLLAAERTERRACRSSIRIRQSPGWRRGDASSFPPKLECANEAKRQRGLSARTLLIEHHRHIRQNRLNRKNRYDRQSSASRQRWQQCSAGLRRRDERQRTPVFEIKRRRSFTTA